MSDLVIRPAMAGDLPQVLGLLKQLNPDDPDLDPLEAQRLWSRLLASHSTTLLVAACEARLLATCTLTIAPNLTRNGRAYALVENVVTDGQRRERGIGKAVLQAALDRAWRESCYKVMLATGSKRPETLGFYESVGFTRGVKTAFEIKHP